MSDSVLNEVCFEAFLHRHQRQFTKNSDGSYTHKGAEIGPFVEGKILDDFDINREQILNFLSESHDEDICREIHNMLMSQVFGNGKVYQSSFKMADGDDYDWLIDFGMVKEVRGNLVYYGSRLYNQSA